MDGTGLANLTNSPADDWWPVAWSPDGTQIAFVSDRYGKWDIFRMKPDGTNAIRLTDDPNEDFWPVWTK